MAEVATETQLEEFVAACRQVAAHGLVRCSSGNFSMRLDGEHMLVSGTQTWLSTITADRVSLCRIADGTPVNGIKPSVESRFHAGILQRRGDVNCVLHFQSPAATTLCCIPEDRRPEVSLIIEMPFYVGPVASVPFLMPGSQELADGVIEALTKQDMAMLANHGLVTVGKDPADVIQRAVFFELACDLALRAGGDAVAIPSADADRLRSVYQGVK